MTATTPRMVVWRTCADDRRTAPLAAEAARLAQQGTRVFWTRSAGGGLEFAGLFWFFYVWRLVVFFKAGATEVLIENHTDCAGLSHQRNSPRERLMLRVRRIKTDEEHHVWLLQRAERRIRRMAGMRIFGGNDVTVKWLLVDSTYDPASNVDPIAESELIPA
jgi:hypothetical protein